MILYSEKTTGGSLKSYMFSLKSILKSCINNQNKKIQNANSILEILKPVQNGFLLDNILEIESTDTQITLSAPVMNTQISEFKTAHTDMKSIMEDSSLTEYDLASLLTFIDSEFQKIGNLRSVIIDKITWLQGQYFDCQKKINLFNKIYDNAEITSHMLKLGTLNIDITKCEEWMNRTASRRVLLLRASKSVIELQLSETVFKFDSLTKLIAEDVNQKAQDKLDYIVSNIVSEHDTNSLKTVYIDPAAITLDKDFFDAWRIQGDPGSLIVDMPAARELHRNKLKKMRIEKWKSMGVPENINSALDSAFTSSEQATLSSLRTIDNYDLSVHTTTEELKTDIPSFLT